MNERHRVKRLMAMRYLLALPGSIWLNFTVLPLRQAWRLPVLVSHRTVMENLSGKIELDVEELRTGCVKIGFATCQCSDFRYDRTRLNLRGCWRLQGDCAIGAGCHLEVSETGCLTTGRNFHLGPRSVVVCHKSVTFGRDCLTSWNCTIMDTDQHELIDNDGVVTNADREIKFGNNVWLGCHVVVPKGVILPDDTTVGAGSVLRGRYDERETVLAGNPAVVLKRGVKRIID